MGKEKKIRREGSQTRSNQVELEHRVPMIELQ